MVRNNMIGLLALATVVMMVSGAQAVQFNAIGDSYSQDFDSLISTDGLSATFVDNSTIASWWVNSEEMDSNSDEYFAEDGSSTGGEVYSFGADGNSDRALGYVGSGGNDYFNAAVKLENNTGSVINEILVGYTGEQWRSGGDSGDNQNSLVVSYQVFNSGAGSVPADTDQAGWTVASSLEFTPPQPNVSAGAMDGNAAANRTVFSPTSLSGLNWADGQELWLRFSGGDGAGSDAGLGIDDLSVSTIPEPGTIALLLAGLIGLIGVRRRK